MEQDPIRQRISEVLEDLLKRNWKPPVYAVSVGSNGAMIGAWYDYGVTGELECKILAEWYPPEKAFKLPMNIMFTNSEGRAARVEISRPDQEIKILN
jgi:hypothetical protein